MIAGPSTIQADSILSALEVPFCPSTPEHADPACSLGKRQEAPERHYRTATESQTPSPSAVPSSVLNIIIESS
jgi:hypothetical protein